MKNYQAGLLLFVLFIVGLSSCQKDLSGQNGVLPGTTPTTPVNTALGDSVYLDRIFYVESNAGTEDTTAMNQYGYDLSKRVISLFYHDMTPGSTGSDDYIKLYSYNSADTLPFLETLIGYTDNDTTKTFFFYNGTQRIKDSVLEVYHTTFSGPYRTVIKTIKNYHYTAGQITSKENSIVLEDNSPSPQTGHTYGFSDTAVVDGSGNVTAFRNWNDVSHTLEYTSTYTYDNKINPFSRISNFKALPILPGGETFIDELGAKNNRLQANEIYEGLPYFDEDLTGRYSYRADGFPVLITEPSAPGVLKIIFTYKKL